ncbi:hypothetical protein IVB22_21475 [Bradyrhizobium sp. 190]|uniref:hypothetical protein n=1 Tax=Bradyrhizobium sp. 190 TaxID=2782658 RepID=UPI001FFAAFA1|nr:hypothetical protein [Bradyrhizobium sp. 190]MCK1515087.1 hypothetical protein [Bradyrhizobium sp. 190]
MEGEIGRLEVFARCPVPEKPKHSREYAVLALDQWRSADAKLLDGELGNLCRIANARCADLDGLLCDDFGDRVVTINQAKRAQGLSVGRVQTLNYFRF